MPEPYPRIVFVGAHEEARRPFEHLIFLNANVAGLFTLEPESLSRMSGGTDLTGAAHIAGIQVKRGTNVNAAESVAWIRNLAPDLLLVVGWTQLIKSELLNVPRIACLGFHASLLPKYRGRAPVNWAILNGETETGNTLMVLAPGADEGDIVCQRRIRIDLADDCRTIYEKVSLTECEMLDEVLLLIRQGRMPRRKQDSSHATVMPKRRPEDGLIEWNWPAARIYNWVRALTQPYPGAFTYLDGRKIIIWKSRIEAECKNAGAPVGCVHIDTDGYPAVVTGDGIVKLLELQREGEPPVAGNEATKTFLKPPAIFQAAFAKVAG
jgi:methionyl-tRNA formyltransferase